MISKTPAASIAKRKQDKTRVAMLFQGAGHYWQPILRDFSQLLPNTTVFTPFRRGFMPEPEYGIDVVPVGTMKVMTQDEAAKGYSPSFTYLSPTIVGHLCKYRPQVIFSTAFSLWTLLAAIFKIIFRWRIVVVFDGSTPGVEYADSKLRFWVRRFIVKSTDAFITNTETGKNYLVRAISAPEKKVFVRPYLIPHPQTYADNSASLPIEKLKLKHPSFIVAGKLIPRKGVSELLQACSLLKTQGYEDFSLLIVGDGAQRSELEEFTRVHQLEEQVRFMGAVDYEQMDNYYEQADVFVFPTLEDVWGLVTVEAMMFGMPILCSKWAGSSEIVADGENGYIFDPHNQEQLAELMSKLIGSSQLVERMGQKSRQIMTLHKPIAISQFLAEVVEFVQTN